MAYGILLLYFLIYASLTSFLLPKMWEQYKTIWIKLIFLIMLCGVTLQVFVTVDLSCLCPNLRCHIAIAPIVMKIAFFVWLHENVNRNRLRNLNTINIVDLAKYPRLATLNSSVQSSLSLFLKRRDGAGAPHCVWFKQRTQHVTYTLRRRARDVPFTRSRSASRVVAPQEWPARRDNYAKIQIVRTEDHTERWSSRPPVRCVVNNLVVCPYNQNFECKCGIFNLQNPPSWPLPACSRCFLVETYSVRASYM